MVGYKILEVDREKIGKHPILKDHSKQLFCPICCFLVREPIGVASCPHRFCSSCLLERNAPKAVCPVDKQEFLVQETYLDKLTEEAMKDINICCTIDSKTGEPCKWVGQIRHLEVHMDLHHKGAREATAQQAQYQAENCAQLGPALFPSTAKGAVPGPSTLPLFDQPDGEESWKEVAQGLMHKQLVDHNDIQELKQQFEVLLGAYNTEKHQREQLENVVASTAEKFQLLEHKQSMDRTNIDQLQQQLAAFSDAVVTEKRERERLQNEMRVTEGQVKVLQSMDHREQLKEQLATLSDALATVSRQGEELLQEVRTAEDRVEDLERQRRDQNATEQCKRQLEVFAVEFAEEKRKHEQLQDNVVTADGKIQVLEQELETQKNMCASAGAECARERERGIETRALESGLLQEYIGRLQSGHLDSQRSLADLEVQFRRFEDERL
ncbi:myosin-11-like isoform X3 [Orbicella faveolata]|uniref:myosin-11-like isoform X3 n=1 Tax=Orbicella faveolata TaxID=48498 RepID=UPI0009E38E31|nr:myosin-11-like isoform X3 [Orbicella faveolata]